MATTPAQRVEMIPIDRISIINPRERNRRIFSEIVESIAQLGLKRPITVTRRQEDGGPSYNLVCGQGRLEACLALNHTEVPALVVSADEEDCLIASLVENCARRRPHAIDYLQDIGRMKRDGYSSGDIARKTGLSADYISGVNRLLEKGEDRLLRAVEMNHIPISVAQVIAEADDHDVQTALQNAYENKLLRGRKLISARRLVEIRKRQGKGLHASSRNSKTPVSSAALIRAFEDDAVRKRALIRRSEAAKARLVFIAGALCSLVDDDGFFALLEKEGLSTLPGNLAIRMPGSRYLQEK
jgi:ParB family chromosome partitioning protein